MKRSQVIEEGRRFGTGIGGLAILVGLFLRLRGAAWPSPTALILFGLGLVVVGRFVPQFLSGVARRWSAVAEAVSLVGNGIVLGAVYFVIVTPIGILLRLSGQDPLQIRGSSRRTTRWRPYPARQADRRHYERLA